MLQFLIMRCGSLTQLAVGILTLKSRTDTLRRIGNLRTAALVGIISAQLSGLLQSKLYPCPGQHRRIK